MTDIVDRVRRRLRALRDKARRRGGGPTVQQQVRNLRARVNDLEAEVMENRQLARRIAELTDVVEQFLLPGDGRKLRLRPDRGGLVETVDRDEAHRDDDQDDSYDPENKDRDDRRDD